MPYGKSAPSSYNLRRHNWKGLLQKIYHLPYREKYKFLKKKQEKNKKLFKNIHIKPIDKAENRLYTIKKGNT